LKLNTLESIKLIKCHSDAGSSEENADIPIESVPRSLKNEFIGYAFEIVKDQ
jgi:hypothetical protein